MTKNIIVQCTYLLTLLFGTCIPSWSRDELYVEGIQLGEELGLVDNVHVGVDEDPAHPLTLAHDVTKVGPGLVMGVRMQSAVTNYKHLL